MATTITMPQLGESVSEGTIGHWLKQEGDTVKKDEPIVEIITDKITAELPSPAAGRLGKILVGEDQTVKVGTPIATIEEVGAATAPSAASPTTTAASAPATSASQASGQGAAQPAAATATLAPTGGTGANGYSNGNGASTTFERGEKVSPLARRLAQEHGIDLGQVRGTGENGRVRKEDVLAHIAQRGGTQAMAQPTVQPVAQPALASMPSLATAAPTPGAQGALFADDQMVTPTPARRAIAEHMVRSKATSPHATTVFEVDMTNLARWLEHNKDAFKQREGYGISYQTFVIKATAEALREQPYVNATWMADGQIALHRQINIGISIALENNLIVPVIRDADKLSIAGIARAVSDLVSRGRNRRLMPQDTQGGTFTVNNPGVFGTMISMAIINQPNAAILTMDGVVKRPVVVDDAIAIRSMMYMSLSFDHRVIDGLVAAQFLAGIKRRLESWGPGLEVY